MQKKNSNRRGMLVAVFALIVIVAGVVGYTALTSDSVDCNSPSFYGYRLDVPSTAGNVQETCRNGLNPTYQSSFTISPDELESLKQGNYISDISTWQTTVPGDSAFNTQASQATSVLYGVFSNGAVAAEVLIDTSREDLYTLYVRLVNID